MRKRIGGTAALGALALASLLAAMAWGGGKLETESETTPVEPGQATLVVRCEDGKAVSGGFDSADSLPLDTGMVSGYGSVRSGRRAWKVFARNHDDLGNDGELTAFAYCRAERLKSRSRSIQVGGTGGAPMSSGQTGSVKATCPRGMVAVSGGFDTSDTRVATYESRKAGRRGWRVSGQNTGPDSLGLVAKVNCREAGPVRRRERTETIPPIERTEVVARCKPGRRVVSGGFEFEVPYVYDESFGPFVVASRKRGKRAWATSFEYSNEADTVTVYAYCEKA